MYNIACEFKTRNSYEAILNGYWKLYLSVKFEARICKIVENKKSDQIWPLFFSYKRHRFYL